MHTKTFAEKSDTCAYTLVSSCESVAGLANALPLRSVARFEISAKID
jgi:hypothetical protein